MYPVGLGNNRVLTNYGPTNPPPLPPNGLRRALGEHMILKEDQIHIMAIVRKQVHQYVQLGRPMLIYRHLTLILIFSATVTMHT